MKIKIECCLSIGYPSKHEDMLEIEVAEDSDDKTIKKEVEDAINEWASNYIDLVYKWHNPDLR